MRMSPRRTLSYEPDETYKEVVKIVGGRLAYLNQAATHRDMLGHAQDMLETERAWLKSHIGLIPDCSDRVLSEVRD